MIFSHDTEHALGVVVDLINTGSGAGAPDTLSGVEELLSFVHRNGISDVPGLGGGDVTEVRALRERFQAVFNASDVRTAVNLVNRIVGGVRTTPHLTDHDGHDWHIHFFAPGARIAEHLSAECGMALAYVVSSGELDRLRTCEAPGCDRVLVDLSRNRCRRYCDSRTCGNRTHVAAYRARRREAAH